MKLSVIPAMLSMIPSVVRGVDPRDLEKIKEITRLAYPAVPQLSTDTLAEWMQSSAPLLLVDVRSPKEFAVSHLAGAVNLRTVNEITNEVTSRNPPRTILYCSVGFRSSRLAHQLAQHGVGGVLNLEGAIFEWANQGRPVFRGDMPVQRVHPYGKRWAGLLKAGLADDRDEPQPARHRLTKSG